MHLIRRKNPKVSRNKTSANILNTLQEESTTLQFMKMLHVKRKRKVVAHESELATFPK